ILLKSLFCVLLLNDSKSSETYTLSLHDALPILGSPLRCWTKVLDQGVIAVAVGASRLFGHFRGDVDVHRVDDVLSAGPVPEVAPVAVGHGSFPGLVLEQALVAGAFPGDRYGHRPGVLRAAVDDRQRRHEAAVLLGRVFGFGDGQAVVESLAPGSVAGIELAGRRLAVLRPRDVPAEACLQRCLAGARGAAERPLGEDFGFALGAVGVKADRWQPGAAGVSVQTRGVGIAVGNTVRPG